MHEPATGPLGVDRTRERSALLNQLMLACVVLVVTFLVLAGEFPGDVALFFAGALGVFVMTGVTLVVPWDRVAPPWLALVPAVDILAIGAMRISSTLSGFGLLWVFPAMWLAAGFGVAGIIGGTVASTGLFALAVAHDYHAGVEYGTLLFPLTVLAVSLVTFVTARRSSAQRALLDRQARVLVDALQRTRQQEQELAEVLDAVDFGVVRIEADGAVAVANDAHERLQHALGDDAPDAYGPDGTTQLAPPELPLARARRGEAFDHQLVWFGPPDGRRQALSVTARRLRLPSGADVGAVVVSSDVTAEMTALRARDELVASVSHELRTPLTSILGFLDLVLEDPTVPAEARARVEVAERNAERLLKIIGDILAASQRTHDATTQLSIEPVEADVAEIVRRAAESAMPRARERGIEVDDTDVRPVHAVVDPSRLRQVLDNLIANAIAYNRERGRVKLATHGFGSDVRITVHDTGIGVTAADLPQLFQRFYRARAVREAHLPGTGLGLAISRDIVRAHDGDISVESTPGVGTTFTVRLPKGGPSSQERIDES
ncbi:PAS domain-containing sensor histidine kinase [Microbacterium protaetiae]|uniref:histidine kinase n=1 Tax=Microbacterium protaetiae TaxID=2509458 RepID=A0A4P6EHX8_9MICO|nr:PAS domain-containing sensor histidine kinase [Microbacterium protaetiae]QAY61556.1 PAS domain-containing sensor histidine kinase [Microbacterium protaetiae]